MALRGSRPVSSRRRFIKPELSNSARGTRARALASETGGWCGHVTVLVGPLTDRAPIRRRIRFQALPLDRLSAAHARAIGPERDPLQRALDRADLLDVARHLREVD